MMKFAALSRLERFKVLETFQRKVLKYYHLQAGEENLCVVTRYTNELEMEVRTVTHPKENEVLLRVGSCCISTFDFDYLMRFRGKDQSTDKTLVLGAFGTGIVLETGTGAQEMFDKGDRVVIEPGIFCDKCSFCITGKTNLCPQIKYLGTEGQDGILCRFINHPAHFTHKLPPGITLELGTLTTKVASCIHAYHRAGMTKDSKVLVMGTSLIGLLAIMIFKFLGVGSIFVAETNNYKLKMARNAGADYVIKLASLYSPEYPEYLKQIINSITYGEPDIVIDTMGTASSIENSFNLTRSGGRLMLMRRMIRPVEVKFFHTTLREIDLVGAYSYTHSSFMEALKLLSNDNIPLKNIAPIRIPLERALDAFSHGRATGGENLFILVNCYKDEKEEKSIGFDKKSKEKTASIPELKQISPMPETIKPPVITESPSIASESKKGSVETKDSSKTDDPAKHEKEISPIDDKNKERIYGVVLTPKSNEKLTYTVQENEKKDEIKDSIPSSTTETDNSAKLEKEKVTAISPTDDKKKEETKKEKVYEIILTPKSAENLSKSIALEMEKVLGEIKDDISSSTPQTNNIAKTEKEKVISMDPTKDKKKEETLKAKVYEVILTPKNSPKYENPPWPQDEEKTAQKKELPLNKKDDKENNKK